MCSILLLCEMYFHNHPRPGSCLKFSDSSEFHIGVWWHGECQSLVSRPVFFLVSRSSVIGRDLLWMCTDTTAHMSKLCPLSQVPLAISWVQLCAHYWWDWTSEGETQEQVWRWAWGRDFWGSQVPGRGVVDFKWACSFGLGVPYPMGKDSARGVLERHLLPDPSVVLLWSCP